jgi:hypothetical protein
MGVITTVKDTGPKPGGSLKPGEATGAKTMVRKSDGRRGRRIRAHQTDIQHEHASAQHQENKNTKNNSENARCTECNCVLGQLPKRGEDECMCGCHCECCPGSLECNPGCQCDNDDHCYWETEEEEDAETNAQDEGPVDTHHPTTTTTTLSTDANESVVMQWTIPDDLSQLNTTALVNLAIEGWQLKNELEQTQPILLDLMALLFTRVYMSSPMETTVKKTAAEYPKTTTTEQKQLLQLFEATVIQANKSTEFFQQQLLDIVKAIHHSRWNFQRILTHRIAAAQLPPAAPINHWTAKQHNNPQAITNHSGSNDPTQMEATFLFDTTKYSSEQIRHLKAICQAPHLIAETTRKPTDDEFTIMYGIMTGSILVRALPQFLKRCCQFDQFQWFHRQMILRAEGELVARLPTLSVMVSEGQNTKRLVSDIMTWARGMNQPNPDLHGLLRDAKAVTYNPDIHALHFHFYTKQDAAKWEHVQIPFRKSHLKLTNPDAKYRTEPNGDPTSGYQRPNADGLVDDRYQAQYSFRLTNVLRTMALDKFAKKLTEIAKTTLLQGVPMDSYGPNSQHSMTWECIAASSKCPPGLVGINRIIWNGHSIYIHHRPGPHNAPCQQCAQVGHHASHCQTPQVDWTKGSQTIIVTQQEIGKIPSGSSNWHNMEEAKQCFEALLAETCPPPGDDKALAPSPPIPTAALVSPPQPSTGNIEELKWKTQVSKSTQRKTKRGQQHPSPTIPTTKPRSTQAASNTSSPSSSGVQATHNGDHHTESSNEPVDDHSIKKGPMHTLKETDEVTTAFPNCVHQNNQQEMKDESNNANPFPRTQSPAQDSTPAAIASPPQSDQSQIAKQHEDTINSDQPASDSDCEMLDTAPPPTTEPQRTRGQKARQAKLQSVREEEIIEDAIKEAQLERLRTRLEHRFINLAQSPPLERVSANIEKAIPHIATKSSKQWILEALGGHEAKTPGTGNCQFYALAAALNQKDFQERSSHEDLILATTILKYGIFLASTANTAPESKLGNIARILDFADDSQADVADETTQRQIFQYYKGIALSSSDLHHILERRLWGGYDSLRMAAKVLHRQIFLISEAETDRDDVYLTQFKPGLLRHEGQVHKSIMLCQPGTQGWLQAVAADHQRTGKAPIILTFRNMHYNAVLLYEPPQKSSAPRTRQRTLHETMTLHPQTQLTTTTTTRFKEEESGPTRDDVLDSQESITSELLVERLGQSNWTLQQQKDVVHILVTTTDTNKRAPLAEAAARETSSSQDSDNDMSEHAQFPLSDSDCEPDSEEASSEKSYAFHTPSPDNPFEEADAQWATAIEEWRLQYRQTIPPLLQHNSLKVLAMKEPDTFTSLLQTCPNPLAVLDHLPDDTIKGWMEAKRLAYCITQLTVAIKELPEVAEKVVLIDWVHQMQHCPHLSARGNIYRTSAHWTTLRTLLPTKLRGEHKIPFLEAKYTRECAFALMLDEVFPTLAKNIMVTTYGKHSSQSKGQITIFDVYKRCPAFVQILRQAIRYARWSDIEDYMLATQPTPGVRRGKRTPASRATRC